MEIAGKKTNNRISQEFSLKVVTINQLFRFIIYISSKMYGIFFYGWLLEHTGIGVEEHFLSFFFPCPPLC